MLLRTASADQGLGKTFIYSKTEDGEGFMLLQYKNGSYQLMDGYSVFYNCEEK